MLDHTLHLDVGPWAGRRRAGQIEQIEVRLDGRAQADGTAVDPVMSMPNGAT